MFKEIIKFFRLVEQGKTLKDKFIILAYLFFRSPLNYLGRYKKHKLFGDVTVKNEDGTFFCGNNIFSVWCGSSFHEPDIKKYFKLKEGIFIDVGANIGKYSIIVGKELNNFGKVLSFEPMRENFEILEKNIKLNNLNNVLSFELALGNKEGEATFYLDREGVGGGGHSLLKEAQTEKSGIVKVQVKKMDNLLNSLKLTRVDLIKIDVEGAESEVLKGAKKTLKKFHPKIIFEAWDNNYLNKCLKILKPLKYHIKKISKDNYLAY